MPAAYSGWRAHCGAPPDSPGKGATGGATTAAGLAEDDASDMEPSLLTSAMEVAGSVAIATAAALCSAVMAARESPAALGTIAVCCVVLTPFVVFASIVMFCGLLCCVPVVVLGMAVGLTPVLFGQVRALWAMLSVHLAAVSAYAQENPVLVAGVSIAQSLERSARRVARCSIEEGAHASWALAVKVGCTGMPETVTEGMGGAPLATYASSMRRASSRGTKSRSTDCTHMNCKSRSVSTCRSTPAPCSDLSGALWKCAGD